MTDTKPTIDEQIAKQKARIVYLAHKLHEPDEMASEQSILASLEELKRIQSAEMPVEPEFLHEKRTCKCDYCKSIVFHIDALKAVIQRKDAEAREQRERIDDINDALRTILKDNIHGMERERIEDIAERAESLAQEKAALIAENEGLRKALHEIREIWSGMEGIPIPETACESYLLRIVTQMKDAAIDNAMRGGGE